MKYLHSRRNLFVIPSAMLRRFIFILVLLTISFFVYRRISPEKADALVDKIRTTYNSILGRTGTVELLTGEVLSGDILSGEILTPTPTESGQTGTAVAPATGGLLDNADENALTGDTVVTPSLQATPAETTGTQTTPKPASQPKKSSDTQDTQNLINSLFK